MMAVAVKRVYSRDLDRLANSLFACAVFLCVGLVAGCSSSQKSSQSEHENEVAVAGSPGDAARTRSKKKEIPVDKESMAKADGRYELISKALETRNESLLMDNVTQNLAGNQNDIKSLNALGVYYLQTGRPLIARLILRRALDVDKSSSALYANLGVSFLMEGEREKAIDEFRRALDLDPGNLTASAHLGTLALEAKHFKKAGELLEKVARADSKNEAAQFNYARASLALKEFAKAEKMLENLTQSKSRNPMVFLNYAESLIGQGKEASKARQAINKAKILSNDKDFIERCDWTLRKIEGKTD